MQSLQNLLVGVPVLDTKGALDKSLKALHHDHQQVQAKTAYFAVIAYGIDGHQFISVAIEKGATVIVCEVFPKELEEYITYLRVPNCLDAIALMASNFYDNPTSKLKMIGVTGTNGKTSTVSLLHQLFRNLGFKVGLLSTVVNKVNDLEIPTQKTTPHATEIHRLCRMMVDEGCEYCFMELSSHGIHQRRNIGITFAGAVFTNITHDHLDYHSTFGEYLQVKKSFLDSLPPSAFVISNIDDSNSSVMTADVRAKLKTLSIKQPDADYYGKIVQDDFSGLILNLENNIVPLQVRAAYNAYNVLSVYAVGHSLGIPNAQILAVLPQLKPINGRFDYVVSKSGIIGIVDYAHTPDALLNLYQTLNAAKKRKLITVMGCAGDKDPTKRPEMAKVSFENSDYLIITADNPRTENPEQILEDMQKGLPQNTSNLAVIWDRRSAIQKACSIAQTDDIILLAGKGHEQYQEIMGVKHPWNDKAVLKEMFES